MYLLDTNACIGIINERSAALLLRLRRHRRAEIAICAIVKAELAYGAYKSRHVADNLRVLERFFSLFYSFPFDDECIHIAGQRRAELERLGTPIGSNDLLIAAIAIANDRTLVTANTREFGRITGLMFENWEQ